MDAPPPGYALDTKHDGPWTGLLGPLYHDLIRKQTALRIRREHCNHFGLVHGGALVSLVDYSLFVIAADYSGHFTGTFYKTLSVNVDFLGIAKEGALLEAGGTVLKASRDKSHVFVEGWVKEGERRVAAFRAIIVSAGKKKKPPKLKASL